jgi:methyl-accepting chemotaxis protein
MQTALTQHPSHRRGTIVGRSLMLRVLLPVGALLVALIAAAVVGVGVKDSEAAREALSAKTKLIADIASHGTVEAIWNLDTPSAKASLAALAADPDYIGSELSDERGTVLASDGAKTASSGTLIVEKAPVIRLDGNSRKQIGALELRMSTARADAAIAHATQTLALIGIFALLAVCCLLLWILKRATKPIVSLTATMAKLSSGEFDTEIPALDRADEVGRMAHAVEVFKRNAIEINRLNEEQARLKERAERDRVALLDKMAGQFESTVSPVLASVAEACAQMATRAETMAGRMTTAEQGTHKVMQATNATSENIHAVAAAAEELSASITEIASQVNDSAAIAGNTSDAADRTSTTIAELSEQAHKVGSIIGLIDNIASQTNLLALNATIEAARAGEAGKGFSVVATEVKSLAGQTARATGEISENIQAIQAATTRAVGQIKAIAEVANHSREIATGIAGAIEQQSAATREISSNVTRAASSTQTVAESIRSVDGDITDTSGAARDVLAARRELGAKFQTLENEVQSFVATVRAAR